MMTMSSLNSEEPLYMLNNVQCVQMKCLIQAFVTKCDESSDTVRCERIAVWQVIGSALSGLAGLGSMLLKCSIHASILASNLKSKTPTFAYPWSRFTVKVVEFRLI